MTLPKCIGGVTNPMWNHSPTILPLLSISYIYGQRNSTKETPKLADLRRLMTYPNLRRQVANATVDALPPIPDGTCISGIATDMADVMLSTAAESVPRSKRLRGA